MSFRKIVKNQIINQIDFFLTIQIEILITNQII
jgi:hypothetical protein